MMDKKTRNELEVKTNKDNEFPIDEFTDWFIKTIIDNEKRKNNMIESKIWTVIGVDNIAFIGARCEEEAEQIAIETGKIKEHEIKFISDQEIKLDKDGNLDMKVNDE
ncbi:MAG: hypothetical protein ACE5H1_09315 [Thermodesulfobacteriota bacterium]